MKRAEHIKMTEKEFKQLKRKEFKNIMKTFEKFNFGCAYIPLECFKKFDNSRKILNEVLVDLREWWKNA